jgi:hypothetical protein
LGVGAVDQESVDQQPAIEPRRRDAPYRFDVTDTAVPTSTATVPQSSYNLFGCLKFLRRGGGYCE